MRSTILTVLVLLLAVPAAADAYYTPIIGEGDPDSDIIALPGWQPAPQTGWPEAEAVVVGDVDGDGADEVAAVVPHGSHASVDVIAGRPLGGTRKGRVRIGLDAVPTGLQGVGDVDGDGRPDLAIMLEDEVVVVYGRASWGSRIDAAALGAEGFRITGLSDAEQVVTIGDRNGDGRPDIAIGSGGGVHVVYLPRRGHGGVDVDELAAGEGVWISRVGAGRVDAAPGGDIDGDGRPDLVVTWTDGAGGYGAVGLAEVPAGPWASLASLAAGPDAWSVTTDGIVDVIADQDLDGRADLAVDRDGIRYTPRVGTHQAGTDLRGFPLQTSYRLFAVAVPVGDQDGDGRTDFADNHALYMPGPAGLRTVVLPRHRADADRGHYGNWTPRGSTADVDGDGRREILVVGRPNGDGPEMRAEVWRSRALGREPEYPWMRAASNGPHYPPPEGPGRGVPDGFDGLWRETQGDMAALAATPTYRDGVVTLHVLTGRPSDLAWGYGYARPWNRAIDWRKQEPLQAMPEAGRPYLRIDVPLKPAYRELLEREGRLRMLVDVTISVECGDWCRDYSSPLLHVIVVTRREPPEPHRRTRRTKGSFDSQRLVGWAFTDFIDGRSADDVLLGRDGPDVLRGGTGNDELRGERGHDVLDGDDGDDLLDGGPGNDDLIETRFGEDTLDGGAGSDWLSGARGGDVLRGGPGDDVISGGSGADQVDCGPGEDIVFRNYAGEEKRITNCEHVYEEPGVLHAPCAAGGTDGPETLLGSARGDVCAARGGNDDVEGGGGDDRILGGAGNDRLFGRFGGDVIEGGDGDDELEGGRGRDTLDGGAGKDRLNGGYDPDVVRGGAGNDRITALGGGADRIDCGPGMDVATVDSADTVRGCETVRRSGAS